MELLFILALISPRLSLSVSVSLPPELGVLRPLRRPNHHARVHGGEERPECLRGQDPATAQGQLPPERGAQAHAEQGVCDPARPMTPSVSARSSFSWVRGNAASSVLLRLSDLRLLSCWLGAAC